MRSTRHDLVIIGGGPAGTTAAAAASRRGLDVLLLEAGSHPRRHVGESLLPGIIPILSEIGALEAVESAGFARKTGSTHWNWGLTPRWDLWFHETDAYDHAWLVDRARFDAILFDAALRAGADARSEAVVRSLIWQEDRLAGVRWTPRGESEERCAHAPIVLDASGQAALVARDLGLREVIEGLRHQAAWAHFEGGQRLPPPREAQALFVAGEDHWVWCFPLGETRFSIGAVWLEGAERTDLDDVIAANAELSAALGPGLRRVSPVRRERDWSYRVGRVAGPGWLAAGDASGFVDPVLSTGVFLGMHAAWHAATTAADVLRDGRSESEAFTAYQTHHRRLFDDMLRIVRFYYQRNLHVEDYFWESKRILLRPETEVRPQRSFLVLTSGLVRNLPFEEARLAAEQRRSETASERGGELRDQHPEHLSFVCLHLEHRTAPDPAALYFLVEPRDETAPALFRTRNWDLSCLAPKYGNDPISEPALEPHLRALSDCIREQDTRDGEPLGAFWSRVREPIARVLRAMEPDIALVRAMGE